MALTDLRFFLKSAQNCKKCTFLDNLRTITQEGNMETRQMTSFFHLRFLLQLFVTFIFVFENSQNSFSCAPPFSPFWSVKYLNFRHPEVTKNPYYVLPPERSQKKVSAHGLQEQ